jgi:hypothetical protein
MSPNDIFLIIEILGYFAEMACPWKKPPIQAYRYYVHTHHNGMYIFVTL